MDPWKESPAPVGRMASAWQPRAMAVISFATAAVLAYGALIPLQEAIDPTARVVVIVLWMLAGLVFWFAARFFRVWMVYTAIATGLALNLAVLSAAENEFGMVLGLTSQLWICILVGLSFPPPVARVFAGALVVGMTIGEVANPVTHGIAINLLFAASFIVTMEILTRMTSRLRMAASTDPLTGFLNRSGLERQVERVRGFRRDQKVALLMVDLDNLKDLNDRDGHLEGDRMIREFAASWKENVRAGDLMARVGGDEFLVVSSGSDPAAAEAMVERLRQESPLPWSGGLVFSEGDESLESMIARADRLLYAEKACKKQGSNR